MKLDLLDTPVRATWDLHAGDGGMPAADADRVLRRLIEARLFFVTLERTPLLHPECDAIVFGLGSAGMQVLVMTEGGDAELQALSSLPPEKAGIMLNLAPFVDAASPDFAAIERVVGEIRSRGFDPGISLVPSNENIDWIVPLLDFCNQLAVPRFKLPNVRIDDNFQQSGRGRLLRPGDLEKLRNRISGRPVSVGSVELEIHDLFLWEMMSPDRAGSRSEYGGCQAANSLAHINRDGSVLPCVSWPEPLGSLLENSFAEIWSSGARTDVCARIASRPPGCGSCRDYEVCFGGCRGLAQFLDTDGGLDPMCNGAR